MHFSTSTVTLTAATLLTLLLQQASAHGFVQSITSASGTFPGANPHSDDPTAGWPASNQDNGFASSFTSSDIICHNAAVPGSEHVPVAAGSTLTLQWKLRSPTSPTFVRACTTKLFAAPVLFHYTRLDLTQSPPPLVTQYTSPTTNTPSTWPESHHGPMLDYLAPCNGPCPEVAKESLRFTKIAERGLVSGSNPGRWGSDEMIAAGNKWQVTIPRELKAGNYVLRHETIALHSAGQQGGAQAYPQCVNLQVTGGGSVVLGGGVAGTALYKPTDAGILVNIYQALSRYEIPGPAVGV